MEAARRASHLPAQLTYDYSLFAPGDATAPKVCRDFVRAVLLTLDREPLVLPAALCTSELVTNVHLHSKGSTMLRFQLTPARLRIGVYDESRDPPVTPVAEATACWGRGLALVAEVADAWGVAGDRAGRYAKGVWFELGSESGRTLVLDA
ncbi:ATP-binding protein [Streptomyces sp. NBC_00286]|uniref:ATP-binding protein n=1 Tax=Streptomyces sp. NBC_00286 TaxID=2975701 RepID=UPI002E2845AA|nr:ATP-binding protein [Streptomyces sp. NBC_00286]